MHNVSDSLSVYNYTSDREYAFLGERGLPVRRNVDFIAPTFAMSAGCRPITSDCAYSLKNLSNVTFTCPSYPAFFGNLAPRPIAISFFTDSTGRDNNMTYASANPFY